MLIEDFIQAMPDAVVVAREAGHIQALNAAAQALFGSPGDELVGQPLERLLPRGPGPLPSPGAPGFHPTVARRRDGSAFVAEVALHALSHEGAPLVVATVRDVTAPRARDEALRRLLEEAHAGQTSLELASGVTDFSPQWPGLLGVGPHVTSELFLARVHPEDLPDLDRRRAQVIASGSPERARVRLRHASGDWRHFDVSLYLEPDGEGRPRRLHSLWLDVTDAVHTEEARRAASEQVVVLERHGALGRLAAGVAHELNSPLAALSSDLVMAARALAHPDTPDGPPRPEAAEALHAASEALERVGGLVGDLRALSRRDDQPGPVDLRRVIESSLRLARHELRDRAQVVTELGPAPCVEAVAARLGQVLLNLLVNAAQALPEGSPHRHTVTVALRHEAAARRVVVEVRDTGPGIAPDVLPRLFTPFFTTKPPGVGTGLGLAIGRRIMEELGGQLQVESPPGQGATFRMVVPSAARPSLPSTAVPSARGRRGRVLVIDDDPDLGSALRRLLQPAHDVEVLQDARDALSRLRDGQVFDAIVSDLMMPHMSGMEFHAQVAHFAPGQAARIVFLTGGASTPQARLFLRHTENQHLEKPFDPAALVGLLTASMG